MQKKEDASLVIGVAILAAGGSRRMGRPKLLLPWGTTTVVGHLIAQWKRLGATQIAVVAAPDAKDLHHALSRLGVSDRDQIINAAPDRGMFSSIQCAARWSGWKPGLTHLVIALGDQPHLKFETLRALLECGRARPEKICQPTRGGHARHPVLMPMSIFRELSTSGAADFKKFLDEHDRERAGLDLDDAGLDLDMDTPADYARLRRNSES